ncbi:hypothetical protein VNO78_21333 [Psophocarpus tetragonolobus]|uniref:Uncharacterized protein n=1 Tax=Psophocarpus tetragonolobus TaxID=3891 RepID=A0AAN9SF29_PSOTE
MISFSQALLQILVLNSTGMWGSLIKPGAESLGLSSHWGKLIHSLRKDLVETRRGEINWYLIYMAPVSARTRMKCKKVEERKKKKNSMKTRPYATTATPTKSSGTKEPKGVDEKNDEDVCATPKGKRFRIPEVLTCPPAPKKRRVTLTSCSSKRSITFFASPDIELFLFSAIKSVPPASSFTPSGV